MRDFIRQEARPLPVILLLDVSGSMQQDGKIDALNDAVKAMIESFKREQSFKAEIHLAIITFGANTGLYQDLAPVSKVNWAPMAAEGLTPLGEALRITKNLIEDRERIPSRAYRPCVVLVSDGQPDPGWEPHMKAFTGEGRSAKCDRWSMGIGADADLRMLKTFLDHSEKRVFSAADADAIKTFFKFVTMTTTSRTTSQDPNVIPEEALKVDDPFGGPSGFKF